MPNGEVRPVEKGERSLGDAVAVRVAQQGDAVGARHRRSGLAHEHPHEEALDPAAAGAGRRRRGGALRHQHVAVRQREQPARMIEAGGEGVDAEARRGDRRGAGRPAGRLGDVDGGQQGARRLRQTRRRPGAFGDAEIGGVAAAGEQQGEGRCPGRPGPLCMTTSSKGGSPVGRSSRQPRGGSASRSLVPIDVKILRRRRARPMTPWFP